MSDYMTVKLTKEYALNALLERVWYWTDEEGNSESVVCQMYVDIVGKEHKEDIYSWVAGAEAQGIDLEKDKDKVFITFRPLY